MSSGSSKQSSVPQAPTPTYGANNTRSESTATQQFSPWQPVSPVYGTMAGALRQYANQGPQSVGPSNYTNAALASTRGALPELGSIAQSGMGNYGFLSNAADVANNPYVQGMLGVNRDQAMQSLTEDMLPALQSGAIGVNNLGSSRLGLAQGKAIGDTQRNLQQTNAQMMMGAYTQGLGAQQQALGSMGALQSAQLAPALAQREMGQTVEGYQRDAQDARWRYLQNLGAGLQYMSPLGTLKGHTVGTGRSSSGPAGGAPTPAAGLYGLPQTPAQQAPPIYGADSFPTGFQNYYYG